MYKCTIFIHTIYTHYSCTLPMFTNPVRIFCTIYMYNFHVHYCSITNLPHKNLPSSRPKCWLEWTREERHKSRMLKWYSNEITIHRKNAYNKPYCMALLKFFIAKFNVYRYPVMYWLCWLISHSKIWLCENHKWSTIIMHMACFKKFYRPKMRKYFLNRNSFFNAKRKTKPKKKSVILVYRKKQNS